jgi:hypothetical protein
LVVLFIFVTIKISGYLPPTEEEIEVTEGMKTPTFGEPEYVGSERCKDCHWREYDTWRSTLHSKFMQVANEYTVMGDFERNNTLTTKVSNKSPKLAGEEVNSTMFKKDGKFYVNTIGPNWESHNPDWESHDYMTMKSLMLLVSEGGRTILLNSQTVKSTCSLSSGMSRWRPGLTSTA